jgi:DNA topoisomerase-2
MLIAAHLASCLVIIVVVLTAVLFLCSPLTRFIFHPHDDPLLKYQYDDNQKIEPVWYIPIIPMVLVNGADGIGTGWMTKIPNYNPREIVNNLKRMLNDEEPEPMVMMNIVFIVREVENGLISEY